MSQLLAAAPSRPRTVPNQGTLSLYVAVSGRPHIPGMQGVFKLPLIPLAWRSVSRPMTVSPLCQLKPACPPPTAPENALFIGGEERPAHAEIALAIADPAACVHAEIKPAPSHVERRRRRHPDRRRPG